MPSPMKITPAQELSFTPHLRMDPPGRFIQADTIVPNPHTSNNPVNRVDPSGHAEACLNGDNCKHLAPSPKTILTAEYYVGYLKAVGITINGNVGVEDARTFFKAYQKMDASLHWKFKEFVGSVTFNFKYVTDGHYGGTWQGNYTIDFYATNAGQLPENNIFHEMGHVIENDILGGKPSADLASNTYNDSNGNFVMGIRDGSYDRQTYLGYGPGCAANDPWNYEQHPRSWEPDGNTGGEEFADMYLNYVAGTIDIGSTPGITRYNFMRRWLP